MHKKNTNIRWRLAELMTRLAIHKAMIIADPEPWLDSAHDELNKAYKCFRDIEDALSPDTIIAFADHMQMEPRDVVGAEMIKNNKVRKIINAYMYKQS